MNYVTCIGEDRMFSVILHSALEKGGNGWNSSCCFLQFLRAKGELKGEQWLSLAMNKQNPNS